MSASTVAVPPATETWSALGTTVVLCAPADRMGAVRAAVERELEHVDAQASRFRPDSELSAVNRARGARVPVSPGFMEALVLALGAAEVSGGAVDPTLGYELAARGYDRDWSLLDHVPRDTPLIEHRPRWRRRPAHWRAIELRDDPPSVRLPAEVRLDLGATAKGLAADRSVRAGLQAAGHGVGVLVSLGGDIATAGPPPPDGWIVCVGDDHRDPGSGVSQTIAIAGGGLATSSLVVRRWSHAGRANHHILDPATGDPVSAVWRTASVAAATCADANIAATAALVLGAGAPAWLATQRLPARLVAVDGTVHVQGGWPR